MLDIAAYASGVLVSAGGTGSAGDGISAGEVCSGASSWIGFGFGSALGAGAGSAGIFDGSAVVTNAALLSKKSLMSSIFDLWRLLMRSALLFVW